MHQGRGGVPGLNLLAENETDIRVVLFTDEGEDRGIEGLEHLGRELKRVSAGKCFDDAVLILYRANIVQILMCLVSTMMYGSEYLAKDLTKLNRMYSCGRAARGECLAGELGC